MACQTDHLLYVGHGCLVVSLDGQDILIDNNFSNKICGLFKRQHKLTVDSTRLTAIKVMVVTDAHQDHLDFPSYKFYSQEIPIVTPVGFTPLIRNYLSNSVIELKAWMSQPFGPVTVHAVPALHGGFRLSGLRYTAANGYVLQSADRTVYVAGDTGYGPHFEEIGKRFKIDVACLPIGGYEPGWLMKNRHLTPEEALRAFDDLKAKMLIPTGWGAFQISLEPLEEPIKRLEKALPTGGDERVKILLPGESVTFS